ncbi:T9SS type A sorting domain-containing protein, partial [Hymenobacter frigidus]|uniref:T9SS type A sorting domain-containing protein n=1 Tax=Hymenobacter frigidus TaxID=1524095 RepID=UPI001668EE0A
STLNDVVCSDNSNVVTVTPNAIAPGVIAGSATGCSPFDPAAFTGTAGSGGGAVTYQWQSRTGTTGVFADITGATLAIYDAPAVTATTDFRRVATSTLNGVVCSDNSNVVTVTPNNCITAHIYPTQTTCCNYQSGGTAQLLKGCLALATQGSKTTVANAIPGVFFYYGSYTASASGGLTTIVVQQSVAPSSISRLFSAQNTSNVRLTTGNCQSVPGSVTYTLDRTGTTATIVFTAAANQTYVVSVKYDMKSIVGATVPTTTVGGTVATYTFSMTANGSLVPASTGQLPLVNGCSDTTPPASGSCPVARIASAGKSAASGSAGTNNLLTDVYPNPTSSDATITFSVAKTGYVVLDVYNAIGMKVATLYNGEAMAGQTYSAILKGADLAIGTYFYRVITDGETRTTRFLIMK